MKTTIKAAAVALLRGTGAAWAVRLADRLDPPPDVTPSDAGGPGPRPKARRWWWPW